VDRSIDTIKIKGEQKLDNFSIDSKSTEFSYLINLIVGYCEFLTFDPEDKYWITPNKFWHELEKLFFKMEKYGSEIINYYWF
jgi:hypothetical protein